ncbi:MAG: ExeA family protein [Myxococcota bacterium]
MYESFYRLGTRPFNVTPDPRFLFLSESHKEALANLLYGIQERKGFILLTGEVGTGKTTLLHTLLGRLPEDTKTAFIFNTRMGSRDFFQYLFEEFDLPFESNSKSGCLITLNKFLIERLRKGMNTVLIVDEAQNLSPGILEEIRLMSNLETPTEKLIQILLVGQPELGEKLSLPELRQLRQRISVRYRIQPLSREETRSYVLARLRIAGNPHDKIFDEGALDVVYRLSGGIPRLVNLICDSALLAGYAQRKKKLGADLVKESVSELELETVPRGNANGGPGGRIRRRWNNLTAIFRSD